MRINLQCPFQDKDLAKQRGARWDPRLRVWYVQDVADLSPFSAWLPQTATASAPGAVAGQRSTPAAAAGLPRAKAAIITRPALPALSGCACTVLPWEDCDCTRAMASQRP